MIRFISIAIVLFATSASAQPADPYAPAPTDPYADPAPKKPPPKAKPGKKTKQPAETAPADPYADPAPQAPADPYTAPAPAPKPRDTAAPAAPTDPYAATPSQPAPIPARVRITDVPAVQGLLAVQRLDAWLLADKEGENPIAKRLVMPTGAQTAAPTRPWFHLIPSRGEPTTLAHEAEIASFEHLPGAKITYQGYRDLEVHLRGMLKGKRAVAVEYTRKPGVPAAPRLDAGTLKLLRGAGVVVKPSDTLVQYTKAIWGDAGRIAHYVAAHHIVELRKDALAFVAKQLQSGAPVSEYDVQQRIARGMQMRGVVGPPPVIAAGANTADPYYVPNAAKSAPIKRGDLIVISLAGKLDKPDGIFVAQTWVAVADARVREDVQRAFEAVKAARNAAIALITDRSKKRRPITGAEVDQATRAAITKAGYIDPNAKKPKVKAKRGAPALPPPADTPTLLHRTGHSLDDELFGAGTDLDDYEVRDTRILTTGTGFTVGPGVYLAGGFGVRSEVSVYLAPNGPELTVPAQDAVDALFAR